VQVKLYSIIYELLDQMKDAMAGLLEPELRETVIGHAEVKQIFQLSRGIVAGCLVTDGRIARTGRARILRKRQPVYDGGLSTLRRFQDDVKEVRSGLECGIKLGDFSEYQVGDVIECYQLEQIAQKLVRLVIPSESREIPWRRRTVRDPSTRKQFGAQRMTTFII
jgi:translation initiation factor IF-2